MLHLRHSFNTNYRGVNANVTPIGRFVDKFPPTELSNYLSLVTMIYTLMLLFLLCSCGSSSSSSESSDATAGLSDINGAITSKYGGQAQMSGWVLVASEKPTNIARVAEVDKTGLYSFLKLNANREQTLVLLSPNYVVTSVLGLPSDTEKTIKQFFKYQNNSPPSLIDRGRVLNFQNTNDLTISSDLASDQDGDGKPDGMASLSLVDIETTGPALISDDRVDTDLDGIPNDLDSDKDGDGVIDTFDPDDDGDAILDVIDEDSNGDSTLDVQQTNTDAYFPEGVEWISVQLELSPQDNDAVISTLLITAKVRAGVNPIAVKVRGPSALLNGSQVDSVDASGKVTTIEWDQTLKDDGLNEDGAADNLLFARKVILGTGKLPKANQVVFVQLMFGSEDSPWYWEYPYTFPTITIDGITANYDSTSRTVQLVGNPFGTVQEFSWVVNVFDQDGLMVYTSEPQIGTKRTVTIPETTFEKDVKYTFKVNAQLQDKVPGYAPYISNTPVYDIE